MHWVMDVLLLDKFKNGESGIFILTWVDWTIKADTALLGLWRWWHVGMVTLLLLGEIMGDSGRCHGAQSNGSNSTVQK